MEGVRAENRKEELGGNDGFSFAHPSILCQDSSSPLTNRFQRPWKASGVGLYVEIVLMLLEGHNLFACIVTLSHRPPIPTLFPSKSKDSIR